MKKGQHTTIAVSTEVLDRLRSYRLKLQSDTGAMMSYSAVLSHLLDTVGWKR